jgi:signal transduction histidine kinase
MNHESHPVENPRILIIDDNPKSCLWAKRVFNESYETNCAISEQIAGQRLAEAAYDVILLNMAMTTCDSLRTLKTLRDDERALHIPIVMMTNLANDPLVIEGLQCGADDYLTTPVDDALARTRIRTQIDLKQARDELRSGRDIQNQLLQMASHDIKIPMTNVRMAENMLWRYLVDSPDSQLVMDSMAAALDSLQEVVEDFLDAFSVRHELAVDINPVNVDRILFETALQHNVSASRKAIKLEINESQATVLADRQRLRQIINNLVSNAIKYSPHDTTTRLWTRVYDDGVVRICVQDQGPGVSEDERHLLYTEFGRTSVRPTGQEGSAGLGLWIVRKLVEAMDGKVGVEFPAEGGSIFWVEFPEAFQPMTC